MTDVELKASLALEAARAFLARSPASARALSATTRARNALNVNLDATFSAATSDDARTDADAATTGRAPETPASVALELSSESDDDDDDATATARKRRYVNVTGFPFPLTPVLRRKTTMETIVPGRVWALEQEQGIGFGLGVTTNVRMTVVRMRDGALWVHDPIAPTEECVELLAKIGGEVKYCCLSTTQYEHKIFAPAFTRAFPKCELWIAPGQFSFPLPLPNAFLGLFPKGTLGD